MENEPILFSPTLGICILKGQVPVLETPDPTAYISQIMNFLRSGCPAVQIIWSNPADKNEVKKMQNYLQEIFNSLARYKKKFLVSFILLRHLTSFTDIYFFEISRFVGK